MRRNEESIAIYSRKSKFTGKGESIGNQVELCKEYVRNMFGEEYVDRCVVFEDEGFSGGNLQRPDFKRMMEEVRKRKFKAIVVYRLDRISRNISDFTGLIDELTKLDVSFVSIKEQFDTSTPMAEPRCLLSLCSPSWSVKPLLSVSGIICMNWQRLAAGWAAIRLPASNPVPSVRSPSMEKRESPTS